MTEFIYLEIKNIRPQIINLFSAMAAIGLLFLFAYFNFGDENYSKPKLLSNLVKNPGVNTDYVESRPSSECNFGVGKVVIRFLHKRAPTDQKSQSLSIKHLSKIRT